MPILYLVRHAEPAALWGSHPDPGLSTLGHEQAARVGENLATLNISNLISSPLMRCQETAAPLIKKLGCDVAIHHNVAEIPVPPGVTDHRTWLTDVMHGAWGDDHIDPSLRLWRENVGKALLSFTHDTIIFSHFVAINAAVGIATGNDKVTIFKPGHASVTVLESDNNGLNVHEWGHESAISLA